MTDARIAWVTGASRGIGRATALRLAWDGHDIAIGYNEDDKAANALVEEVETHGRRACAVQADMADHESVGVAYAHIAKVLGTPDILVASHGIYTRTPLEELEALTWRRTLEVNLDGAFYATQAALPAMRKAQFGRIVYLGSILGRTGSSQGAHYAASKAALLGLARSVARETARDGITVNVVAPSMIDTDILANDTPEKRRQREANVPVGRIGTPKECAAAIAYLVSDEAGYVTGTEMRLDGGFQMG